MIKELEHPLMNGAGCVKTRQGVEKLARSAVSAVVVGSITRTMRMGNQGTTYIQRPGHSLNALGLPNPGAEYYYKYLPVMVEHCHSHGKPVVVSLAGMFMVDWNLLVDLCSQAKVDGVELNFGCPNVQQDHSIWSFDPQAMRHVMIMASNVDLAVGVKLSPFSNPQDLVEAAAAVPHGVEYVATSNTFPNAFAVNGLSTELGGMSGAALKGIALGQVKQLRALLHTSVHVVGVGGVRSKRDIDEYLQAGASAVQATTAYYNAGEDPMVFSDILANDR